MRLTESEAEEFLDLYGRVAEDMDEAFEDAARATHNEEPEITGEEVEEKWGMSVGRLYTVTQRGNVETFVENAY